MASSNRSAARRNVTERASSQRFHLGSPARRSSFKMNCTSSRKALEPLTVTTRHLYKKFSRRYRLRRTSRSLLPLQPSRILAVKSTSIRTVSSRSPDFSWTRTHAQEFILCLHQRLPPTAICGADSAQQDDLQRDPGEAAQEAYAEKMLSIAAANAATNPIPAMFPYLTGRGGHDRVTATGRPLDTIAIYISGLGVPMCLVAFKTRRNSACTSTWLLTAFSCAPGT